MITRFGVRNFKALRDVGLDLTPIHVLIGPNDSGKTSILEAMEALCRTVDHDLSTAFTGSWNGRDLVWNRDPDAVVSLTATFSTAKEPIEYEISCRFPPDGRQVMVHSELAKAGEAMDFQRWNHPSSRVCGIHVHNEDAPESIRQTAQTVFESLAGAQFYRWDPRVLALPVAPDSKRGFRMETSGFGLAWLLDSILGYDRERFTLLEKKFCSVFPAIRSIQLVPMPAYRSPADQIERIPVLSASEGKGIYFRLADDGPTIPASQASDGTLLVLAYLAVAYSPKPPRLLLLEEPENGIHPKRLRDVLGILRNLTEENERTQIVMTTHSPYALDLFQPEEVTLCLKDSDGSVFVSLLSESSKVREQAEIFTLGEIWTGEGDAALSTGPGRGEDKR
jgi:predicted ATPase